MGFPKTLSQMFFSIRDVDFVYKANSITMSEWGVGTVGFFVLYGKPYLYSRNELLITEFFVSAFLLLKSSFAFEIYFKKGDDAYACQKSVKGKRKI